MFQIEIWALPQQPLKKSEWEKHGYGSLEEYIRKEIESHAGHMKKGCVTCEKYSNVDLASFGTYDPKTGEKDVKFTAKTYEELPTESIDGVLLFE